MKHTLYYIVCAAACLFALTLTSCKDDEKDTEFSDWQNKNTKYFEQLYNDVSSRIAAGDKTWKIIRNYTFEEPVATKPEHHIIVHILKEGTGYGNPLFTDTVRAHYRGWLIPSPSYPEGKVFDESWAGDYNLETMMPAKLPVNAVVDGLSTALQNMHIGDRWEVYIPQQLGYGKEEKDALPAYSTLRFDLTLMAYYRAGKPVPEWKAKKK